MAAARATLADAIKGAGVDWGDPRDVARRLAPIWRAIIAEYGLAAATLAAQFFDEQRAKARARGTFVATAGQIPFDEIDATFAAAMRAITPIPADARHSRLTSALGAYAYQHIKGSGHRVTINAAFRDPAHPKWARVPSPGACVFCQIMGSRGFVYRSRETAQGTVRYHTAGGGNNGGGGDCRCRVVTAWSARDQKIDDYDPDALYAQYLAARERAGSPDLDQIVAAARKMEADREAMR